MKFGRFDIDLISDGTMWFDGGAMFGVVPRTLWERVAPPDEKNRIRAALNCLLVRTHEKNILIDTGVGTKFDKKFAEIYKINHDKTVEGEIGKLGLKPEDIHIVINTHLHFDHAGTNTKRLEDGSVVPTFPKATYVIRKGEWDHANHPNERSRASYLPENWMPLEAAKLVERIDNDQEIVPGVSVLLTKGHLKHHQSVKIESEGHAAVFLSDALPMVHHLKLPWIMSYDLYPVDTLETKRKLIQQALDENWLLIFYHDAETPAGYLRKVRDKVTVEPVVIT